MNPLMKVTLTYGHDASIYLRLDIAPIGITQTDLSEGENNKGPEGPLST